jgi:hypothetical protein
MRNRPAATSNLANSRGNASRSALGRRACPSADEALTSNPAALCRLAVRIRMMLRTQRFYVMLTLLWFDG